MLDELCRRRELTEAVPDHVFRYEHLFENLPIVDGESVADEFWCNLRGARPRLDGAGLRFARRDFLREFYVHIGTFFERSCHERGRMVVLSN